MNDADTWDHREEAHAPSRVFRLPAAVEFDSVAHATHLVQVMGLSWNSVQEAYLLDRHALLSELLGRFAESFPYANVDYCVETLPAMGVPIPRPCRVARTLDFNSVYRKLVVERKGGICYELHGLFLFLLEAVGYSCRMLRVMINRHRRMPELEVAWNTLDTHAFSLVELDRDNIVVCEIGIGSICVPLKVLISGRPFTEEQVSPFDGLKYRIVHDSNDFCELEQWDQTLKKWVPRNRWRKEDNLNGKRWCFPDDNTLALLRRIYYPDATLQTGLLVFVPCERGAVLKSIWGDTYAETRRAPGMVTQRIERKLSTPEEVDAVLKKEFGVSYHAHELDGLRLGPSPRYDPKWIATSDEMHALIEPSLADIKYSHSLVEIKK